MDLRINSSLQSCKYNQKSHIGFPQPSAKLQITRFPPSGDFGRKFSDQRQQGSQDKNNELFSKLMSKNNTQSLISSCHQPESKVKENSLILQRAHDKINNQAKYFEHKEKLLKIKARHLQIKKKTQGLLASHSNNSSPVKCLSSGSTHSDAYPEVFSPLTNPQKPLSQADNSPKPLITLQKPANEVIHISSKNRIESFDIIQYIDQGCFGKVYLVRHTLTNFLYCLKKIQKSLLDEASKTQLIREIKIQSYLNHPNIANLYQFFVDQTFVYLLLQPCLDGNLYKQMKKQPTSRLPEKEVKRYIKEVCCAVEYMHKNDIIHRDIKPENILLHEGSVKICDFGWAVYSPLMRSTQCGTPLYTSPEIIKNELYNNKTDVWCIGVLTFELLFGTTPFKIRQINDMAKIVEEEVMFPSEPDVTSAAMEFIRSCMEKKPARRFSVRQAIDHEFVINSRVNEKFRNTIM